MMDRGTSALKGEAVRRALATIVVGAFVLTATGCPKDEYDPDTWIDKLSDFESASEFDQAVSRLEQLKDPKAIKPLAKAWEKYNRASSVMRAIVHLADQEKYQDKKGPFWDDAIPVLEKAVSEYDVDQRSIGDAIYAADALGRARVESTIPTLVNAATKKMPKLSPMQRVRIASIRALGYFGKNTKAVDTLIRILEADLKEQDARLHAAAANALAETGHPKALQPLLKALYANSMIYQQVRKAVARLGPVAIPELIKIFKGKHTELEKFAKENKFNVNCSSEGSEQTTCKGPGALRFKAATLLGDLVAQDAANMLAKRLTKSAATSFYAPNGNQGPSDHAGIVDALRKIGDPKTADEMFAYAKAPSTDDLLRPIVFDAYSMLAPRGSGLSFFKDVTNGTLNGEKVEEDSIRISAGLAYSRLAHTKKDLAVIEGLIKYYNGLAKKSEASAKKTKNAAAKAEHTQYADSYRATARTFDQYKTRARVGIECKADVKCYVGLLELDSDAVLAKLKIPGAKDMKRVEKSGHREAAIERALLEITKLGPKAKDALPTLLKVAESTERTIRQGVLLAMTRIADKNCAECRDRLAEIIEKQAAQKTLSYLTADTRIVYYYFLTGTGGSNKIKTEEE